jgi:XTP/dITP diphosphohydrolase
LDLCFASNNLHKLSEIRPLLEPDFRILSLQEIGCNEELPETQNTLEGNSRQKAEHVFNKFKIPCFADDSGLEVEALNNAPGVYSARYAGLQKNDNDNIGLLLKNLIGVANRKARFRTIITLIGLNEIQFFEGIVNGIISEAPRGTQGFGYDPVFQPAGQTKTMAEMNISEKNRISHRALAIQKLSAFLKAYIKAPNI